MLNESCCIETLKNKLETELNVEFTIEKTIEKDRIKLVFYTDSPLNGVSNLSLSFLKKITSETFKKMEGYLFYTFLNFQKEPNTIDRYNLIISNEEIEKDEMTEKGLILVRDYN